MNSVTCIVHEMQSSLFRRYASHLIVGVDNRHIKAELSWTIQLFSNRNELTEHSWFRKQQSSMVSNEEVSRCYDFVLKLTMESGKVLSFELF